MLYDYQYAVAALLANLVMLISITQQIRFSTRSSRVFMQMIGCNTAATLSDIVTFFTISYPQQFPLWFVYLTNMLYMEFNGLTAIFILRYAGAWTDNKVTQLKTRFWAGGFMAILTLLVITTPMTHWVFGFDEQLHYYHGLLMPMFYLITLSMPVAATVLIIRNRKKFQTSQMVIMIILLAAIILCFLVQAKFSRVDMNNLAVVLVLHYIYVVLENPAFYMYRNTRCLNIAALRQSLDRHRTGLVLISVRGRLLGAEGNDAAAEIPAAVARRLAHRFPHQAFALSDNRFAVLTDVTGDAQEQSLMHSVEQLLSEPVLTGGKERTIESHCRLIPLAVVWDSGISTDNFVDALTHVSTGELFTAEDVSLLIARDHSRRLTSERIGRALREGHFSVVYQPILDLKDNACHSAEALIRMNDPDLGNIRPDEFIPVAEKEGSIREVGETIFRQVCVFMGSGKAAAAGIRYMEINLSVGQLSQKGLAEKLNEIAQAQGVSPSSLNLEITESMLLEDVPEIWENLEQLENLGFALSMDDYGTGFSSTKMLTRVPFSLVKLDRSLLEPAVTDEHARVVLQYTMQMVTRLNKKVLVEGAETGEMVELIRSFGGDYVQGYCYSKPLSEEAFMSFLKRKNPKPKEE